MTVTPPRISEYLPPNIRQALVAASRHYPIAEREALIDAITDRAADQYPELVRPRSHVREGYRPYEYGPDPAYVVPRFYGKV